MVLLTIALGLALLSSTTYLVEVLRGRAQPHRVTRAAWALIAIVALASSAAAGASKSLPLLAIYAVLAIAIYLIVCRRPSCDQATSWWTFFLIALGLVGWLMLQNPLLAILAAIVADAVAGWPALKKLWQQPRCEPFWPWLLDALAALIYLVALGSSGSEMIYIVYLAAISIAFTLLSLRRGAAAPDQQGYVS